MGRSFLIRSCEVGRRGVVHLSEIAVIRGSGTSTLSPRGALKDSPAVRRSGCRPTCTAPLNLSWLLLEAIVLTAPRGGASSPVTRPKSRPRIGSENAQGQEVCIQLGLGFSFRLCVRNVEATKPGIVSVIPERQTICLKVMVVC